MALAAGRFCSMELSQVLSDDVLTAAIIVQNLPRS